MVLSFERVITATVAVMLYAVLCMVILLRERERRRRLARAAAALLPAANDAVPVLVIYATQTGNAERLAWQTAKALHTAGAPAELRPLGSISAEDLRRVTYTLFIASTYGEGDPPDGGARFAQKMMGGEALDLANLHFGLLALGDRDYTHFCGFGRELDGWLSNCGATPLFDRIEVDKDEANALGEWRRQVGHLAGTTDLPDWQAPDFEGWTLVARHLLNPGSVGNSVFHLELEPPPGSDRSWEAGDLVQILAPEDPGRPREYSIANAPQTGRLELLVRQATHADGSLGLASGLLSARVAIGETIALRLRAHAGFRIGDNTQRPLILVGNGTGIAGLRSHLQARAISVNARSTTAPCWLVFGERSSAHDAFFKQDIVGWKNTGLLTRVDLVYSRDTLERDAPRYVQHALATAGNTLRAWVNNGAAIYVCGSLEGMAAGVDQVLRKILGNNTLDALTDEGRYRRDVY